MLCVHVRAKNRIQAIKKTSGKYLTQRSWTLPLKLAISSLHCTWCTCTLTHFTIIYHLKRFPRSFYVSQNIFFFTFSLPFFSLFFFISFANMFADGFCIRQQIQRALNYASMLCYTFFSSTSFHSSIVLFVPANYEKWQHFKSPWEKC